MEVERWDRAHRTTRSIVTCGPCLRQDGFRRPGRFANVPATRARIRSSGGYDGVFQGCRSGRCGRNAGRIRGRRSGRRQGRAHPADDRAVHLDRQADRGRGAALHAAERDDRRRQEDRGDPEGRRRQCRRHPAARAGAPGQRQGELPRRLRADPACARGRAAGDRGQGARDRDGGRHLDHHRALALYRAHQLHGSAVVRDRRRLGGQERHQEGRDHRDRLCARPRCRKILQGPLRRGRRPGRRRAARAAAEPGFRAVPAARRRRQARCACSCSCRRASAPS